MLKFVVTNFVAQSNEISSHIPLQPMPQKVDDLLRELQAICYEFKDGLGQGQRMMKNSPMDDRKSPLGEDAAGLRVHESLSGRGLARRPLTKVSWTVSAPSIRRYIQKSHQLIRSRHYQNPILVNMVYNTCIFFSYMCPENIAPLK